MQFSRLKTKRCSRIWYLECSTTRVWWTCRCFRMPTLRGFTRVTRTTTIRRFTMTRHSLAWGQSKSVTVSLTLCCCNSRWISLAAETSRTSLFLTSWRKQWISLLKWVSITYAKAPFLRSSSSTKILKSVFNSVWPKLLPNKKALRLKQKSLLEKCFWI